VAAFRHEILIARPIEVVFAAVADPTTHPHWQAGLLQTQVESDSHARVGARGVEVRRLFGREARFPYEITVYNPPHGWGFRVLEGPIRPAAILSFHRQNNGTRVESELTVPGLLGWLFGRALLTQQRRNYARLKELLETGKF
jgi:uncharacterized protein YndB with AHSA1/START domain